MSQPKVQGAHSEVWDRKLRPIYDALEVKNYKGVIKLVDSFLKKFPGDHTARVLQAWAQAGSAKTSAANKSVDAILAETPTDLHCLNLLESLLQRLDRGKDSLAAVLAASAAHPKDAGLLQAVFDIHIKQYDYAKAQATAMRLHRVQGAHWLWCAITLLALQAMTATSASPEGKGMQAKQLWLLAETMLTKQVAATPVPANGYSEPESGDRPKRAEGLTQQQHLLWILVLVEQKKFEAAYQTFNSPHGGALRCLACDRYHRQAQFARQAGHHAKAAQLCYLALREDNNNWHATKVLLDICGPPKDAVINDHHDSIDSVPLADLSLDAACSEEGLRVPTWSEACSFIESLAVVKAVTLPQEKFEMQDFKGVTDGFAQVGQSALRGPLLARVDIAARLSSHARASTSQEGSANGAFLVNEQGCSRLAHAIVVYIRALGHLACCGSDLREYYALLSLPERKWLAQQVRHTIETYQNPPMDVRDDKEQPALDLFVLLRYQINLAEIEQEIHDLEGIDPARALQRAIKLMELFAGSEHFTRDLDEKQRGPSDELLALAVCSLIGAARSDPSHGAEWLMRAYLMVEAAQIKRKVSAPLRLAATALAGLLGAPNIANEQFAMLDVKHVQRDSVEGHFLYPLFQSAASEPLCAAAEQHVIDMHNEHAHRAATTIIEAFNSGSFVKAIEFEQFRIRMARSHTHALMASQAAATKLYRTGQVEEQECDLDQLRFNEDFNFRPFWYPPHHGQPSTAAFDWWRQLPEAPAAAVDAYPGGARLWFQIPKVAEMEHILEAQAWRQASRDAIRLQQLQTRVLSFCYAPQADLAPLSADEVTQLAQLVGVPLDELPAQCKALLDQDQQHKALDGKRATQCLQAAVFQAAHLFQVSSAQDGASPANQRLLENLGLCRQLFLALVAWANSGLCCDASSTSRDTASGSSCDTASSSSLATSSGTEGAIGASWGAGEWTWAGLVVHGAAMWLGPCLQVWLRQSASQAAAQPASEQHQSLHKALQDLGESFLKGIMSLVLALGVRIDQLNSQQGLVSSLEVWSGANRQAVFTVSVNFSH
ncbi:hypothetical protein WJX73_009715 [Symbiochloris irregularis]|uniref:Uncharacterized protein n=1 Tax=Symbiochloris irregularis TaxID=706552 RepID=A0AAW1P3A1_9CHLO